MIYVYNIQHIFPAIIMTIVFFTATNSFITMTFNIEKFEIRKSS